MVGQIQACQQIDTLINDRAAPGMSADRLTDLPYHSDVNTRTAQTLRVGSNHYFQTIRTYWILKEH